MDKVKMMDIEDNMLGNLKTADFEGFIKLGVEFSDAVIVAGDNKKLEDLFKQTNQDIIGIPLSRNIYQDP